LSPKTNDQLQWSGPLHMYNLVAFDQVEASFKTDNLEATMFRSSCSSSLRPKNNKVGISLYSMMDPFLNLFRTFFHSVHYFCTCHSWVKRLFHSFLVFCFFLGYLILSVLSTYAFVTNQRSYIQIHYPITLRKLVWACGMVLDPGMNSSL
jgi:hypothetical protein